MNEKSFSLEVDYRYFKKKILETTGIALDAYKPRQMQRRIKELSERKGFYTLKKFWSFLEKNPEEYRKFLDYITINFSEFFRDVDRFNELERKIIPDLLTRTPNLRIWSAACATGEEPYSVAIILEKSYPEVTTRILATDIDEGALEKAKIGIYDKTHVKNVPPVILDRYFIRKGESFIVKENIKRRVKFKKINLLEISDEDEFKEKHSGYLIEEGCISCHDAHWSDNKNLFSSVVHSPVESSECDACHNESLGLISTISRLCFECHDEDEFNKRFKHTPYREGQCMVCHAEHMSESFGLLRQDGIELCRSCHENISSRVINYKFFWDARKSC